MGGLDEQGIRMMMMLRILKIIPNWAGRKKRRGPKGRLLWAEILTEPRSKKCFRFQGATARATTVKVKYPLLNLFAGTIPDPVVEKTVVENDPQEEVFVEDVKDGEEHDDDSSDDEENAVADANKDSKRSKSEKKSRKAMLKLGMKPENGVTRVNIKTARNAMFYFSKSDVFKSPNLGTYNIFGEAKVEGLSSQLQAQAAQQFRAPDMSSLISKFVVSETVQADEEDEEVDETGVEPRDVDLVMTQAGVSKAKTVRALKTHNGDIVRAIMELTN